MSDHCCESACGSETAKADPRWRRVLWIALVVNATMFLVEMGAGAAADSRALQADALDFAGDAAGEVIAVNSALEGNQEPINSDPYGAGWLLRVSGALPADLLDAAAYRALTEAA